MEFFDFMNFNGEKVKNYLLTILVTIIVTYSIIGIIRLAVSQFFKHTDFIEEKKEQTIESVLKNTFKYLGFLIVVFVAVKPFLPLKELLVAGGVLGIVIGFGAQSAIKDFLYGFFFLFEGQFKKGDFVNINGELEGGTVEELGFRAVKIRLLSGKLMTVSNGEIRKVVNGNIERRRIFESMIVSFREDPSRIKEILEEMCSDLNERHAHYLMKTKDQDDYVEKYHVYGFSSLDANPLGFKISIAATVYDMDYLTAVQEVKLLLAQKVHEEKIIMPEQSVFYQTRLGAKQ